MLKVALIIGRLSMITTGIVLHVLSHVTIMHGKFVCLSVWHLAFSALHGRGPRLRHESLGHRYMRPHLAPHGPPEGVELLGIRVDPLIGRDFSSRLIVCTVDLCTFCFVSHCFLNDFWLPLDAANFVNLQAYWFNLCIIQDNAGSDQMM